VADSKFNFNMTDCPVLDVFMTVDSASSAFFSGWNSEDKFVLRPGFYTRYFKKCRYGIWYWIMSLLFQYLQQFVWYIFPSNLVLQKRKLFLIHDFTDSRLVCVICSRAVFPTLFCPWNSFSLRSTVWNLKPKLKVAHMKLLRTLL